MIAVIGVLGLMLTTTNIASANVGASSSTAGHVSAHKSAHKNEHRVQNPNRPSKSSGFKKEKSESRNHKNRNQKLDR
jgi:hypothetical protein